MVVLIMFGKSTSQLIAGALIAFQTIIGGISLKAATLEFDQAVYSVRPGDSFQITIRLDEPVTNGLGGYALKLGFTAGLFAIDAITVTPLLDFDLFEPGAFLDAGADFASVAGFVEFGQPAYNGTEFVTFSVTLSKAASEGQVVLDLSPLLANAVNFVDGLGNALDDSLIFGTAILDVLPPWPVEYLDDLRVEIVSGLPVIQFSGTPDRPYLIQYSSDLTERSWITLREIVAPEDGLVEVEDNLPAGSRFYRVVTP